MKIYINEQIIKRFREDGLSIDYIGTTIIILICLYSKNYKILDSLDDENKSKRVLTLYRLLKRKKLIDTPDDDVDNIHYSLTEKGLSLTKFLLSFDDEELEVYEQNVKEVIQIEETNPDLWIEDWLNLFPKGRFNGRTLRTNKQDCLDRMKWFLKNFKYTKEEIFLATEQYLREGAENGHSYTRNATYFIVKGAHSSNRISDLASACEKLRENPQSEHEYIERDIV